tara:strand:- start:3568 stop:4872 length:1305 start_codon:yes stop_codon:yes gene_type:complete
MYIFVKNRILFKKEVLLNERVSKMLKRLKSLNYSIIDQAIVSGSNFLCALLIVKLIGLNNFGIFSTCWIILLFISTIFVSSIVSPMMAIVPKRENIKKYFGSLLVFQLIFSCIGFAFAFLICSLYFKTLGFNFPVKIALFFSLCVFFHHFQEFFRKYFFSIKSFKEAILIDSFTYLIRLFLFSILLLTDTHIELDKVFLLYLSTSFLGTLYGVIKYKFTIDSSFFKEDFNSHLEISKWLVPSGLLKWTSVNLFLMAGSIILGPIALGIIKLSQNITSVYNLFLLGLENFIPLEAGKIYVSKGIVGLRTYLKKVAIYGSIFTLFLGLILSVFSKPIIKIVYGETFVNYNHILYWFSSFLLFMFFNLIINVFLITINKTRIIFKSYIVASIFSLGSFFPLIHYFGIKGVMLGMLSSYIVLSLSYFIFTKKQIHTWK